MIPDVEERRKKFSLLNSPALLILDGATQHQSKEIDDALTKANIILHFLVPHSSHLTQPLDCLFFKIFKGELRKTRAIHEDFSKSSNRILHAVSSLSKTIGWWIGLKSWHRAGFLVSLENAKPSLSYDLSVILQKDLAPQNEVKVESLKSKRKREKIFFSESSKRRKKDQEKKK